MPFRSAVQRGSRYGSAPLSQLFSLLCFLAHLFCSFFCFLFFLFSHLCFLARCWSLCFSPRSHLWFFCGSSRIWLNVISRNLKNDNGRRRDAWNEHWPQPTARHRQHCSGNGNGQEFILFCFGLVLTGFFLEIILYSIISCCLTFQELAVETSYSTEAVVDEEQPQPPKVESPSFAAFGASKNIHLSQKFRESVNRHSNGSQSEV